MEEERKFSRVENERKVAFAKSAFHSRERSVDLCNCGYRIPKIYFVGREVKKNNECVHSCWMTEQSQLRGRLCIALVGAF